MHLIRPCFQGALRESERRYVEVRVEDTGVGIDGEAITHIFKAFYTTKTTRDGVGAYGYPGHCPGP